MPGKGLVRAPFFSKFFLLEKMNLPARPLPLLVEPIRETSFLSSEKCPSFDSFPLRYIDFLLLVEFLPLFPLGSILVFYMLSA